VVHLWVDPIHGSDVCALPANPNPAAACAQYTFPTPLDSLDPLQGAAPLLHAPAPFKTVTAAIAYIKAATNNAGLPFTAASGYVWKYAIIHWPAGAVRQEYHRPAPRHRPVAER
jgi:hypothetical protein